MDQFASDFQGRGSDFGDFGRPSFGFPSAFVNCIVPLLRQAGSEVLASASSN